LTDHHGLLFAQEEVDFAIPFLDEDIPFCVDPFLLWKSPSQQDNALHVALLNSFNHVGVLANKNRKRDAEDLLIQASECSEVGLGFSATRRGSRIGRKTAAQIVTLFEAIPQIKQTGFRHIEEIQLLVEHVSRDRISDFVCTFLKSFLVDYTMEQCRKHGIPVVKVQVDGIFDQRKYAFSEPERVSLPVNPETGDPVLLVPKRWLRSAPWISSSDYMGGYFLEEIVAENEECPEKGEVLLFNRQNYDVVCAYVERKERTQQDCKNDPLFRPIPVLSAKKKLAAILRLPSGKTDGADRKYEDLVCQLMASLLYPHLDFAAEQSRTDSGVAIRDLVFYNNRSVDFLSDIHESFGSRQIVMELKNVRAIERMHINQLNRYLSNEFGSFGIFATRNPLPRAMFKNTIDLWAGQRRCLIALTDSDLSLMVDVFESRQRDPIEVVKKKYAEFMRACPT